MNHYRVQVREQGRFDNFFFPSHWEVEAFLPSLYRGPHTVFQITNLYLGMDETWNFVLPDIRA